MIGTPGHPATMTVTYRSGTGALVDPPDPLLSRLTRPDGTDALTDVAPIRDSQGAYHVTYDLPGDAAYGSWLIRWTGTVDGVLVEGDDLLEVVPAPSIGQPFGASVEGVASYLPELDIVDGQKINPTRVLTFLAEVGGRVAGSVATGLAAAVRLAEFDPTLQPDVDEFTNAARRLTELGAAAYTQDAAYPEMAAAAETDQRYGAVLWRRFEAGLATLTGNVAGWLEAHQETAEGAPTGPASSFPPPLIRRDIRW